MLLNQPDCLNPRLEVLNEQILGPYCFCFGKIAWILQLFQPLDHTDNLSAILLIIPLQAKRVEEFIEIRHKKILPTRISTLECL